MQEMVGLHTYSGGAYARGTLVINAYSNTTLFNNTAADRSIAGEYSVVPVKAIIALHREDPDAYNAPPAIHQFCSFLFLLWQESISVPPPGLQ
jgi:hypothetical protein